MDEFQWEFPISCQFVHWISLVSGKSKFGEFLFFAQINEMAFAHVTKVFPLTQDSEDFLMCA